MDPKVKLGERGIERIRAFRLRSGRVRGAPRPELHREPIIGERSGQATVAKRSVRLIEAVALLGPREREILRLRFGLDGEERRTREELRRHLAVTRERSRERQEQGLHRLARRLESRPAGRSDTA
jgi:DNA-directed RNA polymerase specialized sigma subunit